MIRLVVIGHLGKDAITNNVNGKTVINFNVAHAEKYKDAQGNQKEKTTWVDCSYWTEKLGVVPFLKKGSSIYVEGQPDVRTYTTNDGRTGASLVLRVASIQLLGSGNNQNQNTGNNSGGGNNYQSAPAAAGDFLDDGTSDLPF
jgi:single-strand DNA-binding protein